MPNIVDSVKLNSAYANSKQPSSNIGMLQMAKLPQGPRIEIPLSKSISNNELEK